ncbi:uncharacterized protein SAPINGB_P003269 [Magnusiomyces paraingens]|uniref:Uncharacterized protein n=1 Tax=Magnusiomyces paraingens TaxID=2606893 RepID=A0A5E8BR11_9ASCO|nr:uncharacterized protein SAPINGB_P003269 [Saprochaete ingens]VVT51957.1 unnamed protein product [Saprochaete ingens]
MDFLKDAVQKAGQNAAQDAAVDGVASKISGALGGSNNEFVDQAASFVKNQLKDQPQSESVKSETTVSKSEDGNTAQVEQKTTYKADYVDKGVEYVEKNVLNVNLSDSQNQQISGYIREGIESFQNQNKNN